MITVVETKQKTSLAAWLLQRLPMAWKVAALFWLAIFLLGGAAAASQMIGWFDLSTRLFTYMALCFVGFALSWLCLAFINAREWSAGRRARNGNGER